jgi:hypothetical protein
MSSIRRCLGVVVLGALSAHLTLEAQAPERHLVSGEAVAIYNLVGRVTATSGGGSDVAIEVSRRGADAGRLAVETGAIDREGRQWQSLRVVYPSNRIVATSLGSRSRTSLKVRRDGTFGDGGRDRGDEVVIAGSGSGMNAAADLAIAIPPGKRVGIYLAVGEVRVTNVEGDLRIDVASAPVTVSGVTGSLTVDAGSGSVDVRTMEGELSVDTGSGEIVAHGVRGPRLVVETGSGGFQGSGITTASVNVESGSGGVSLSDVGAANVSIETGSGEVTLTMTQAPDNLTIETGSGDVEIRVPGDLSAQVDFETGSGDIETDFPVTIRTYSRDSVRGQIGDGKGRIQVETGSGDIQLLRR